MHTRMRQICLSIVQECAEDLKTIDERFPSFPNRPDLQALMDESRELEVKWLIRSIHRWSEWAFKHRQEIDKIKANG